MGDLKIKLVEQKNKVDSNLGVGHRLSIAATPQAMKILSKNIYSNPIQAVLREYACNAADAHTSVGCADKPIEVHLPTYQNQTLKIRDWGPGIKEEDVIPIFSTYFISTKTEDNTQTGFLGLGSKSAFAVADQMIVEIWNSGYHYVWSFYKDEEGYPVVPDGKPTLVEPTVEPTGVLITIPVNDIQTFEDTAELVYKYFNPIPIVWKGKEQLKIDPPTILEEYKSCRLEEGLHGVYALMGNILYPINVNIAGLESYKELGEGRRTVIPFALGDIEFSASRESLEYNKRVISTLKHKYEDIISDFSVSIQAQIDLAKNAYNAVILYNNLILPNKLKFALYKNLTYKGQPLNSYFTHSTASNYDKSCLKDPNKPSHVFKRINSYTKTKYECYNTCKLNSYTKLYYNDTEKQKGLIPLLASLNDDNCYLFSEDIDIDKWCELNFYDKADLIPISSIPKAISNKYYENRRKAGCFSIRGGKVQKDFWSPIGTTIPDMAYYFVKVGDKVLINDANGGIEKFPFDWDGFLKLNILPTDFDIYGVSKSYLKDFGAWMKIEDKLIPILEENRAEIERAFANSYLEITFLSEHWIDGEFKETLRSIKRINKNYDLWRSLYNLFGIPLNDKPEYKIDEDKIFAKYPMLKFVISRSNIVTHKEVQDYITLVDSACGNLSPINSQEMETNNV